MSVDLTGIDTTNGHVDRIPRMPALVQFFLGVYFFCVFCCCFRSYAKITMAFDFFLSFIFGRSPR